MKTKTKPAGRPTINGERKMISVRLPVELLARIPKPVTGFIEMAINEALK